jgi:hypothetical protein
MRTRLATLTLLLLAAAPGQDLEPTRARALRALSAQLVQALPTLGREVGTLVLRATPGTAAAARGAMARVLLEDGFRVELAGSGAVAADSLVLEFTARSEGERGVVGLAVVGSAGLSWSRRFGAASWVDAPGPERLVAEGPFRRDRAAAREGARRQLLSRVRAGLDLAPGEVPEIDELLFESFCIEEFQAEALSDEGDPVYRSFVAVHLGQTGQGFLEQVVDDARHRAARLPWIRGGCAIALVIALGLGYLRCDLRTRGYRTGRLRVLFGILLVAGLFACWGLSP